jgi:hypothetical protein
MIQPWLVVEDAKPQSLARFVRVGQEDLKTDKVDVDAYVDGRPVLSQDVTDGTNKIVVEKPCTDAELIKTIDSCSNVPGSCFC